MAHADAGWAVREKENIIIFICYLNCGFASGLMETIDHATSDDELEATVKNILKHISLHGLACQDWQEIVTYRGILEMDG